jgi:cell division protein FtsW (lipid II flippase)
MRNPARLRVIFSIHREPASAQMQTERLMLGLGGVFIALSLLGLALTRGVRLGDWIMLAVWVLCSLFGMWVLETRLPRRDPLLFSLPMLLTGWGLVVIDRLSDGLIYNFADRQTLWMILSVTVMLIIAIRPEPLRWLREYRYIMLVFGLLLLVSTILFGTNPSGLSFAPQLWLGGGRVFFQPSELLKIILVAFLASYLAEQYPALRAEGLDLGERDLFLLSPRIIGPVILMWAMSIIILVWQRDLGTATLFFGVFVVLLYVASSNLIVVIGGAVLTALASVVGYYSFAVVRVRFDIWFDPWSLSDSQGFQIVQSLLAFAAGGVFGQGAGQGTPTYIPVAHSDFAFAALAEEWGLLGVTVVVGMMLALVVRGFRIAVLQQERPFYALLTVGISTMLGLQSLLIMGGTLRVLPLTGVTLPFLSYGGSSLLVNYMMIGLLLRLSHRET